MTWRLAAVEYARGWRGTWYSWGGDDPLAGWDCSRFIGEIRKFLGLLERGAIPPTANMLMLALKGDGLEIPEDEAQMGDLVFWTTGAGFAEHVEMVTMELLDLPDQPVLISIGSSGGGKKTKTREDAIRDNAFVKERPTKGRPGTRVYCRQF